MLSIIIPHVTSPCKNFHRHINQQYALSRARVYCHPRANNMYCPVRVYTFTLAPTICTVRSEGILSPSRQQYVLPPCESVLSPSRWNVDRQRLFPKSGEAILLLVDKRLLKCVYFWCWHSDMTLASNFK